MTSKTRLLKPILIILGVGLLAGCQTIYDSAHEQEKRDFCGHIENQNSPTCSGNHAPDLPSA